MEPREMFSTDVSNDEVNHPKHYQSGGLETIDVISAFTQDCTPIEAFCIGNALKYLCRWKKKNGVEDLKKAQWYINYLIGFQHGIKSLRKTLNDAENYAKRIETHITDQEVCNET